MSQNELNIQAAKDVMLVVEQLRKRKGISKNKIAKVAGLTQPNVWKNFNLEAMPTLTSFCGILDAVDVDLADLLKRHGG